MPRVFETASTSWEALEHQSLPHSNAAQHFDNITTVKLRESAAYLVWLWLWLAEEPGDITPRWPARWRISGRFMSEQDFAQVLEDRVDGFVARATER